MRRTFGCRTTLIGTEAEISNKFYNSLKILEEIMRRAITETQTKPNMAANSQDRKIDFYVIKPIVMCLNFSEFLLCKLRGCPIDKDHVLSRNISL